jgi:hypothetical protein
VIQVTQLAGVYVNGVKAVTTMLVRGAEMLTAAAHIHALTS